MLFDARQHSADLATDVCIVGAGAAGITLARELAPSGASVVVLESGGLERDEATHDLTHGEVSGLPYDLTDTRLRYFGGTTNHWGGLCRPLQPIDFEPRDWVPGSGWPFPRAELEPYYERAQALVGLGPYDYDVAFWQTQMPGIQPLLDDGRVMSAIFQVNPLRFGPEFRPELEASSSIAVYLNANVVELVLGEAHDEVVAARVATLEGSRFTVTARVFVLAAGGIENARLLLASRSQQPNGVGNDHDLVGRYFMEHLHLPQAATVVMPRSEHAWFYGGGERPAHIELTHGLIGTFGFTDEIAASDRLPGFSAMLVPTDPQRWGDRPGEPVPPDDIASLLVAEGGAEPMDRFELRVQAEQVPHPENRVSLSDETDALGLPRVHLHWDLVDDDRDGLRRALEQFARSVSGIGGRVWIADDPGTEENRVIGGSHHLGTTRMHVDPAHGVVDAQCRVHGITNLYVAGSSVFPNGGYANPTLTIVALALRLADELQPILGPS